MNTFRDLNGRTWSVAVTLHDIDRVVTATDGNVDLLTLVEKDCALLNRLLTDTRLAGQVLAVLLLDQIESAKMTVEDFGRGLAGDCIGDARKALIGACIDFFQNPLRDALRELVEKHYQIETEMVKQGRDQLATVDIASEARTYAKRRGASRGSAASTRDRTA